MDSKSISRKGVGVRLPSLAPARKAAALARFARELGRVIVPSLCRRLRAATSELAHLRERLAKVPKDVLGDELLARRNDELAGELARAGYCLGVLGAGARADLLRGRRERQGLRWFVAESVACHGAHLAPAASELPELNGIGTQAWRTALLAGWCAAVAASQGNEVHWSRSDEALVFALERPLEMRLVREARALGLRVQARALAVPLTGTPRSTCPPASAPESGRRTARRRNPRTRPG